MLIEFLLLTSMALTPPVASCLVILQAQKEGRAIVGAICAVAAVWTISSTLLPPLRCLMFAAGKPPYWLLSSVSLMFASLLAILILLPQWIASAWPRSCGSESDFGAWVTLVTRLVAGLTILLCALALQVVFAKLVGELASSGLTFFLVVPDKNPGLTTDVLLQATRSSITAFVESPRQIVWEANRLPGLPFSMFVQTLALTTSLATSLSDAASRSDEQRSG